MQKIFTYKKNQKPSLFGYIFWSILGFALLPLLLISLVATSKLLFQVPIFSTTVVYLILGVVFYTLFHFFVYQPLFIYVFAHEFTHAIFAVLSGVHVRKIKISSAGGFVELSQSNLVIDLAPYFFPLYTILLTATYLVLGFIFDLKPYLLLYFFLIGTSLAFHYLSNWETLKISQPDLKVTGKVFAIIFIAVTNLLLLNIILALAFLQYINFYTIYQNYLESYQLLFSPW